MIYCEVLIKFFIIIIIIIIIISVDHEILMSKFQDIGLSPIAMELFRSYLQSRYQVVKISTSYDL